MVLALKPLHDAARVRRVIVSTYQAVSGAGLQGHIDLLEGTKAALNGQRLSIQAFAHPIAFNAIPQIGSVKEEGYTSEEMKMVLRDPQDPGGRLDPDQRDVRADAGRQLSQRVHHGRDRAADHAGGGPPALRRLARPAASWTTRRTGRIPCRRSARAATTRSSAASATTSRIPNGLNFWCVSDNLRKGAATNAVQIAELLAKHRTAKAAVAESFGGRAQIGRSQHFESRSAPRLLLL